MNTEQIWFGFKNDLERFVFSKIKDRDTTQDILQEVFIKIHSRLHQLNDKNSLTQWVYQITRNTVNDHFRKRKFTLDVEGIELADTMEGSDNNGRFMKCMAPFINKLPVKYQEAIRLVEIDQLNQVQLAARLGISYSAAKSRVQRGRELLRNYFTDCCEISADKYGNIISHEPKENCLCFNH